MTVMELIRKAAVMKAALDAGAAIVNDVAALAYDPQAAPLLAGRIAPGGRIALSGVLAIQADQVIAAYAPLIALRVGAERDGWVRLEGTRC